MYRFQGLIGIGIILGIAFLCSNNRKRINARLVISGIALQVLIAVLVLKIEQVSRFFQWIGMQVAHLEKFAKEGASFVWGDIFVSKPGGTGSAPFRTDGAFIFAFSITATLILICVLVAITYHFGIMQRIISGMAKAMKVLMRVSGAESLSNIASAFVGQVEAQVMIRPYLARMTMSELLASMSGSLACISGSILVVYINFGAKAEYLLTASLMAAPAALVISKIVWPETEPSQTMGTVKLEVKSPYKNLIDAITGGASDGMKISVNIIAMLIAFIALIAMINFLLLKTGVWMQLDIPLSLDWLFGKLFYPMSWALGVPDQDIGSVATLMGQKLTINEFIAFKNMTSPGMQLTDKGLIIVSFAICGFANFSSIGMLVGGISQIAPERRGDLARLSLRALLCGTLASYLSAAIAGILL